MTYWFLTCCVAFAHLRPIDNLKERFDIILGYESSWQERFDKLNPYWHYSWNWEYKAPYPSGVEFVPMIWGSGGATQERVDYLNNLASMGVIQNVLAFNEPDLEGQANMTRKNKIEMNKVTSKPIAILFFIH